MTWVVAALTLVVGLQMILLLGVLRSHADVIERVKPQQGRVAEGGSATTALTMPDGVLAPPESVAEHALATVRGQDLDLRPTEIGVAEGSGQYLLIAFLSTTCLTCLDIWRDVISGGAASASIDAGAGGTAEVVLVLKGRELENLGKAQALAEETPVPVLFGQEAWDALEVPGSPYFALIERSSTKVVGAGSAQSWSQIVSLASDGMLELSVEAQNGGTGGYQGIIAREDDDLRRAGIIPGHPSLTLPITIDDGEPHGSSSDGDQLAVT
jgi:hypothetical protein